MPLDDRAIAITATFTAEAIQPGLAFWAGELGFDYEIRFAGYSQVFQELLDPAGLFARNRGGFNVVLVRFEDWRQAGIEEEARRLAAALRSAARFSAPVIVVLCPPVHPAAEAIVRAGIADLPAVHLIAPCEVEALYPVPQIEDPDANELGHLPYTPEFFAALATAIARKIHAIANPGYKVIALDCDDTLWAGICGEDGPQGVALDPPRRALQEFMGARRREGMLLALCSKNNEEDVLETFAAHPGMPLRLEDFAACRVNWESKGANLAALADELGLGLDSFILVDDNPKECTEAAAGAPEVLVLPLPAEVDDIPEFLQHVWAFDRARVTDEDRERARMYRQNAERARAERSAGNLEEFLAGLKLEVTIAPMEPAQVARVAQLTRRTNQMNATLIRRSEVEVQSLKDYEVLVVEVKDRFGTYGLSGVMIVRRTDSLLFVDTFLLSCRALGRGVEHRMVARLGEIALERGLDALCFTLIEGPRNRPAKMFLESIGALPSNFLLAREAAALRYQVGQASRPARDLQVPPAQAVPIPRPDYLKIATELRTPAAVLERIHAASRKPAPLISEPPRTELEQDLAKLWAGLLNVPAVGIRDNFFELGGHSLLAVQLLARVRQIYGIDLSLEVVYSGEFTVAELAKAIELKEIEQAGGDYQELLHELEGLSDDEVRAQLAAEQDAV
jgi:FkbH-like protein